MIHSAEGGFRLQEVNETQFKGSSGEYKYGNEIEESNFALEKWMLRAQRTSTESIISYFEVESMRYIIEFDAQSETAYTKTYCIHDNLKQINMRMPTNPSILQS